jgi:hypothetical protein
MFCLNCGAGDQSNEAYCKRCGKWIGSNPPNKRLMVMLIFSLVSAVLGAASAIALYATYLGSETAKETAKWSVYLAATFCIVIAVHQSINFAFGLSLLRRMKKSTASEDALPSARNTRSLEEGSSTEWVGVESVTENSTELLGTTRRTR